jgi:glutamate dehydrogenase
MLLRCRVLLERTTRWLLRSLPRPLDVAATIARFAPGAAALSDAVHELLAAAPDHGEAFVEAGVPRGLAERVAHLEALVPTFDLVEIAAAAGVDVPVAAETYYTLGSQLQLDWLRGRIVALPRGTRWEAMARAALRDDLYVEQAALTAEVLRAGGNGASGRERVAAWLERNGGAVERGVELLGDIRTGSAPDLARLSVAVREIRNLIQSSRAHEAAAAPARS